jgi:ribonuclease VapC
MVIDTSALVAILQFEQNRPELLRKVLLEGASMAAPNALETHMVLRKLYADRTASVIKEKFGELGIVVVPFSPEHTEEATRAFDRFGKGRHPAGLNFGDCIAYALARVSGQPLLFTGDDFSKTDVRVA